jgi:hypothetical protein
MLGHRGATLSTVPTTHPTPQLLAPLGLAALCAAAPPTGLDLEGHTGYLMVPSARTMPTNSLTLGWNHHDNVTTFADPYNLFVAMTPIPYAEVVARMSFPDIGANAKVGIPVFTSGWGTTYLGFGAQDIWGGARFFHSKYVVATQTYGLLETTLGWGTGDPEGEFHGSVHDTRRLDGFFHAIAIGVPLPETWDTRIALIEEHDGWKRRLGARAAWQRGAWGIDGLVATTIDDPEPEYQINLVHRLPDTAVPTHTSPWASTPLVLQFGPWAQTYVGTEVGDFDALLNVDAEAFVTPPLAGKHLVLGSRVRKRVYESKNFKPGGIFQGNVVETDPWWESGTIGFAYPNSSHEGALVQAGWIDGDWTGTSFEARTAAWHGLRAGGFAGYWHSPGWDLDRRMALGSVDWDSPGRTWFVRADAGRYWRQDLSARLRAGRRWGRLESALGVIRTPDEYLVEGRIAFSFAGWDLPLGDVATIRPVPVWKHGLRTRLAVDAADANFLTPSPAQEPAMLLRLRY